MKSFYEHWQDASQQLRIQANHEHEYPAHFHADMEIFLLKTGKYRVTINGEKWDMQAGDIAVIDSFQVHAYERLGNVEQDCVLIIPYSYSQKSNAWRRNKKIDRAVLHDAELCDTLLNIVNAYLVPAKSKNVQIAGVELLLALLFEKLAFSQEKVRNEEDLIRKILSYIQENFQGSVSLKKMAKSLGYAPEHVSRVFHRCIGKGVSQYVNELRLNYIEERRKQGDGRTSLELLYEAGFQSQQTYYRWKKQREK
jgi:AraC-like DNA-binding protein/mannose-6-phosphate isomerase-like protein (cupin superfamily)